MTSKKARVSVVLPVHNAAVYLRRTHRQLVTLDRSVDYEFVIIDDHSSDNSRDQILGWGDTLPGPVRVLSASRRGVAHARNQAIFACTGDYVWLADADDEWDPTIASSMVAVAREHLADLVVCNAIKRTTAGEDIGIIADAAGGSPYDGREALMRLLDGRLQGHLWNKLFLREALGTDPFPATRAHSDLGGMLRVLPRVKRIAAVPQSLYVYFQNPNSILNSKTYDFGDLRQSLKLAEEAFQEINPNQDEFYSLIQFTYRNVLIPSLNEVSRRKSAIDRGVARDVRRAVQSRMNWRDITLLTKRGHRKLAAQASIAKVSATAYHLVYRVATARSQHSLAVD